MTVFTRRPAVAQKISQSYVYVYGKVPKITTAQTIFDAVVQKAVELGADPDKVCIIKPPGDTSAPGYKQILPAKFGMKHSNDRLAAEGTWISKPGEAIVLTSRDCLSVCLENQTTGVAGIAHCGRAASRPAMGIKDKVPSCVSLSRIIELSSKREKVRAFLSGSICPDCFGHDTAAGQEIIKDFLTEFDTAILKGDKQAGRLKIILCNQLYLSGHGIPYKNIEIDATCTKCSPELSSYRGMDNTDNYTFLVIPHQ